VSLLGPLVKRERQSSSAEESAVYTGESRLLFLRVLRNNIRIMRKTAALAALFPTVRGDVLAATLTQPDKWWYLSELAQFLRTTPSSLQRELKTLVDSGILEQRREGTRIYFKAETRSPLFRDLRGLLEKTAGLLPTLQQALEPFQTHIDCAFVYGSVARSQEHALSDVDLLVVGAVGLAELAPALRKAESRLGREVNTTSYSANEFRKKVAAKDHFLSELLRGPKEFVKGSQRDLDEAIGKPRRPTPSNVEKRAR
jgi:predicted nucleotidyltransferase